MMTVVAVESELDDVPAPEQYATWNPSALRDKIAEKDEYLHRAKGSLEAAFRELLGRYGSFASGPTLGGD